MFSEPLPSRYQALSQSPASFSTKKNPQLKSKARHEIYYTHYTLHQEMIKKKEALHWKWRLGTYLPNPNLLVRAITSDKKIQRLEFDCRPEMQISNENFKFIAQILKGLPYLKSLSLSFEDVDIDERGVCGLFKRLKNLVHLERLRFSFESYDITDQTLSCLSQNIRKLSLVNDLELSFSDCVEITDTGLSEIS